MVQRLKGYAKLQLLLCSDCECKTYLFWWKPALWPNYISWVTTRVELQPFQVGLESNRIFSSQYLVET